jgi:hypothetical protein
MLFVRLYGLLRIVRVFVARRRVEFLDIMPSSFVPRLSECQCLHDNTRSLLSLPEIEERNPAGVVDRLGVN